MLASVASPGPAPRPHCWSTLHPLCSALCAVVAGAFFYELEVVPWFAQRGHPISTLRRIGAPLPVAQRATLPACLALGQRLARRMLRLAPSSVARHPAPAGAGYIFSMLGMVAAAVLEIIRLGVVHRHGMTDIDPSADGSPEVPISVWWQVRQREHRCNRRCCCCSPPVSCTPPPLPLLPRLFNTCSSASASCWRWPARSSCFTPRSADVLGGRAVWLCNRRLGGPIQRWAAAGSLSAGAARETRGRRPPAVAGLGVAKPSAVAEFFCQLMSSALCCRPRTRCAHFARRCRWCAWAWAATWPPPWWRSCRCGRQLFVVPAGLDSQRRARLGRAPCASRMCRSLCACALPQAITATGGSPGWVADNVNQARQPRGRGSRRAGRRGRRLGIMRPRASKSTAPCTALPRPSSLDSSIPGPPRLLLLDAAGAHV